MTQGCSDTRPLIQAALDGEMTQEDRARLDAHLAVCKACAADLAAAKLSVAVLGAMPAPKPGPAFAAETVRQARTAKRLQESRRRVLAWSMAAVVTLASAAALGAWAGLMKPALWALASAAPRAVGEAHALLGALGDVIAALGRALLPIGNAAAAASWEGLLAFFPWYAVALITITLTAVAARLRRPAMKLPVLSL